MSTPLDLALVKFRGLALSTTATSRDIREECLRLIRWLCEPPNRTDANCRYIDAFILEHFIADPAGQIALSRLPEELALVIEDMGSQLHDSISDPAIAANFESTPEMLLHRLELMCDPS